MSLTLKNVDIPKTARTVTSKYNFGDLTVGGPALVDADVINTAKASSRMNSALVAYRSRTGDKSKFTVRAIKQEDGKDAVAVWKTAEAPAVAAPAEAPAAE